MSFSITRNMPVNIVSEGGDILGSETREVTYIIKVESFTSSEEGVGMANVSKTTSDTNNATYKNYAFTYNLNKPIFEQIEDQIIVLSEFSGAVEA